MKYWILIILIFYFGGVFSQEKKLIDSFVKIDSTSTMSEFDSLKVSLRVGFTGGYQFLIDGKVFLNGKVLSGKKEKEGNVFYLRKDEISSSSVFEIVTDKWRVRNSYQPGYRCLSVAKAFDKCIFYYSNFD